MVWQINEEDFLRDVKNYVGDKFDDGDYCLKKEIVEEVIYDGLLKLDEFMKDHYMCEYENNNGDEVQTNLREAIIELEIDSFKKEWKLEEINKEWTYDDKKDDDFLGYDFSDEDGEFHDSKICLLKDIEGYEEKDNLLWYSFNDCNDIISDKKVEGLINEISNNMPGNIHFIR